MMMSKAAFGIDIGGTTIKCGLFSEDGTLLKKKIIPTRTEDDGSHILEDIRDCILEVLDEEKLDKQDLIGAGLGVPGSVTNDSIVNKCINLGWGVLNVSETMSALLEIPKEKICIGNDANMAALGEYWKGSGKDYNSLMFITIGTGIGGGLIMDGKPVNGANGAAGEIGHLPIVTDLRRFCACGKIGCLEQVASANGMVKEAHTYIDLETQRRKRSMQPDEQIYNGPRKEDLATSEDVFDLAAAGSALGFTVVEKMCIYMAKALACVACVVDPECFIIGGGVAGQGEDLLDRIRHYYKTLAFHPSIETPILPASLGNDAGMYGAVKLVLDKA